MYEVESFICRFHVYRAVWTAYIGEQLVFSKAAIVKIISLLQFRKTVKRLVMCRGRSLVSPHSSCDGMEQYPAQLWGIEEEAMIYCREVSKYLAS